jgi:hypothetical protein
MPENFTNSTNLAAGKNRMIRVLVAGAGGAMAAPIVVALDAAKLKGRQVEICLYARPGNTYDAVAARGIDVCYAPQDVAGKTYRDCDALLFSARLLLPRTRRKNEVPACGVSYDYRCADRYRHMVLDPR